MTTINVGTMQGVLNTGTIKGNISNIQSNLTVLANDEQQQQLVEALKAMTEGVANDDDLSEKHKAEALSSLEHLSQEATKPKEERSGLVNTLLNGLASTVEASAKLKSLWDTWHPVIVTAFS